MFSSADFCVKSLSIFELAETLEDAIATLVLIQFESFFTISASHLASPIR